MHDDLSTIEKVLAGDTDAFAEIVKRYEGMVATIVRNMIDREDVATDVGQEVFIRLFRSLHKFKGESKLSTYIGRIAINLSLNELKRQKVRKLEVLDPGAPIRDIGSDEKTRNMENNDMISQALSKVIPKYRSVIVLRMIEGYSTKETGNILGIPDGTVLSRLARAQQKLKAELQKLGYIHGEL